MGPGNTAGFDEKMKAEALGGLIAKNGFILLSGGTYEGVMNAVSKGYKEQGGILNIGISPSKEKKMSDYVDKVIYTDMGSGRNYINVLSSDVIVAIGDLSSAGTLSEVALGLIKNKLPLDSPYPIILLGKGDMINALVKTYKGKVLQVNSPAEAMKKILTTLKKDKKFQ